MINPQLSIIIPVYNAQTYLRNCIDSILNQSFQNYEIILIDDGSTDQSSIICDHYAETDERIRVFHKENGGVSSARNLGINQVTGDWIYFCDSDDELLPNGLEIFISQISADIDLVVSSFENKSATNNTILQTPIHPTKLTPLSYIHTLFEHRGINGEYQGYLWTKIFKKSIIISNGLKFDTSVSFNEDRLFILQYLMKVSGYIVYIPKKTYRYFIRESGAMRSLETPTSYKKFRTDLDAFIIMKKAVAVLNDKILNRLISIGIYDSAEWNKKLICMFSKKPTEESEEIDRLVVENIGRCRYYFLRMKRIVKRYIKRKRK